MFLDYTQHDNIKDQHKGIYNPFKQMITKKFLKIHGRLM